MARPVRLTDDESYQTPAGLKRCFCALLPAGLSAQASLAPLGGEGQRSGSQHRRKTRVAISRRAGSPAAASGPFQGHLMTSTSACAASFV